MYFILYTLSYFVYYPVPFSGILLLYSLLTLYTILVILYTIYSLLITNYLLYTILVILYTIYILLITNYLLNQWKLLTCIISLHSFYLSVSLPRKSSIRSATMTERLFLQFMLSNSTKIASEKKFVQNQLKETAGQTGLGATSNEYFKDVSRKQRND